jgi:TonB family protein
MSFLYIGIIPSKAEQVVSSASNYQSSNTATPERIYEPKELPKRAKKAKILKRPDPEYTTAARKNQIQGVVVLRAALMSNGEVTNISVLKGLSDGLSEAAMEAARKIKFRPAILDGQPVSIWIQIEYQFSLY